MRLRQLPGRSPSQPLVALFKIFKILKKPSEVALPDALQELVSRREQDELDRRPGTV
jgi:hypothetical protein